MAASEGLPRRAPVQNADLLGYGRQVIATEAAGLDALVALLDESFVDAVELILAVRGRVIVTGIGKSGHVARKVAATLASTGTPALFVHPTEAIHGDLGMLMAGDGLIAFSNSGTTAELQPVLARAAQLGLPIVGVCGRAGSMLTRQARVALMLPLVEEACPENFAPTTSTAMMMALGDALSLAVMQARGVSRAGFKELHPGGAIGKRLMRVAAVMHRGADMPIVSERALMSDVILTMTARSFGIAGVVDDDGALVGVITDGDLRRHLDTLMDSTAREVMTADPVWVSPSWLIEDALALLNARKITAMFAVEDEAARRPVGIVHVHDFLRLGLA